MCPEQHLIDANTSYSNAKGNYAPQQRGKIDAS
jgi:hypothetical protein